MQYSKGELRRAKTLELIKSHGKISLQEIVEVIGCSVATARRDLDALEKADAIIRTSGGAIYEGALLSSAAELPFAAKRDYRRQDKERIAEAAADLVQEGDIICLTGGTTTFFIAKALKKHRNITIVTNAVNIAYELADAEDITVVVIGGVMRAKSYELSGPLAENVIDKINITRMFLGVDGVSQNHGFTMHSELEARIAQFMMDRSSEVYAVFDQSKLEKSALFTIVPLNQVTGVITDMQLEGWFEQACREQQIAIHTARDHTASIQ
ncbi:DeoR/GlpR family DNA-binding transcription regulator [Paenibacillus sp. J22TS3]|uniref:DeoR/GlpR family DNA-binding transcription regulator n=1 Tax=Paenibacillus sp. J22TS3 TaxID=2807192 RepID=UPI001B1CFFB9|nr:DeoR/GlpR family DNA-binding transcription regulator [Paenibacillus sp. J22TS3]GIP21622.1 transcriptional regulator [Paenibacillus sp. J22TS3]